MKVTCPHCRSHTPLKSGGVLRVHKFYKFDEDYRMGRWIVCPLSNTPYRRQQQPAVAADKGAK